VAEATAAGAYAAGDTEEGNAEGNTEGKEDCEKWTTDAAMLVENLDWGEEGDTPFLQRHLHVVFAAADVVFCC
jgi:hypothetical protein